MNWFDKLTSIFKDEQLRKKILFVLFAFAVFRLAANIPIPGVDLSQLKEFFAQNQFFGMVNLLVGGAMSNFSIVLLGLGPYITAVIILQLLTMVFPKLERMYKEQGPEGKKKFNQIGRVAAVPLAMLQGYGMLTLLQKQGAIPNLGLSQLIASIVTITAGSIFLMWLGELISEKGIGNGVSLMIFAGIIARTPNQLFKLINTISASQLPSILFFLAASLLIIFGVVVFTEARRNIPISYAKRVKGRKVYGGTSTHLPMKVNPAGVIPIIFALALLLFPNMIANFLAQSGSGTLAGIAQSVSAFFQNPWVYGGSFFVLVFLFTYFYTAVTFDPESISENLQKMGGFIPGIRPGEATTQFIHKILYRILFIGATFLGTVAVLPSIVQGITQIQQLQFLIGGTAVLIMVSVILDTWRQVKSQMKMKEYEEF